MELPATAEAPAAQTVTVSRDQLPQCQVGETLTVTAVDDTGVTLSISPKATEPSLTDSQHYDAGYADDSGDAAIM